MSGFLLIRETRQFPLRDVGPGQLFKRKEAAANVKSGSFFV